MKTFLICPVRGKSSSETKQIVKELEENGYQVHWPHRDTDQNDKYGVEICRQNKLAIMDSEVVHVIWDGKSEGCLFDLGMAFMLGKKIIPLQLPELTSEKSFQNMVAAWAYKIT